MVTFNRGLIDLLDADTSGIMDAVISFLQDNVLDIADMVGLATD